MCLRLKRVDNSEDLSGVAAGGCWVGEDETDGLLWVDDEDRADGEGNTLLVDVGGVLVVNPEKQVSNYSQVSWVLIIQISSEYWNVYHSDEVKFLE